MQVIKIPKKSGLFRTCVSPNIQEKSILKSFMGNINLLQETLCDGRVVFGFMRGKNPVSMAKCHIGYNYTISMDLENFFDNVDENKVKSFLKKEYLDKCLIQLGENSLRYAAQGLPTSPAIANIAAIPLDKAILKFFDKNKYSVVYTRYADDLTFSYNDDFLRDIILKEIPQIVSRTGFKVNSNKTRYMPKSAGRRVICGVSVGDSDITPMREHRRKLRAAKHNLEKEPTNISFKNSVNGLSDWCKLKEPFKKSTKYQETVDILTKNWKFRKHKYPNNFKEVFELEDNFLITNDPAYILGMSAYTTGWRSCVTPGSNNFKKVYGWLKIGSKVACLLSDSVISFHGVDRRKMQARCLVHETEDGRKFHDKMYGDSVSILKLEEFLHSKLILPISHLREMGYYKNFIPLKVGPVQLKQLPYFDSLKGIKINQDKRKNLWKIVLSF